VTWVALAGELLLAATMDGVYASQDGGETWQTAGRELEAARVRQVVATEEDRVWITTARGIFQLMGRAEIPSGDAAARRARESWAREPDLGETVQAALVFYGYAELPAGEWARRLFFRRYLPLVTFRYQLVQRRLIPERFIPDFANRPLRVERDFRTHENDEWRLAVRWDLANLIFDPSEMRQRDSTDRMTRRRHRLIRRVIRTYATRRTLLVRIAEGRRTTIARQLTDRLRLEELTAQLDIYTNGFFTMYRQAPGP
jgi:hypothetical protein